MRKITSESVNAFLNAKEFKKSNMSVEVLPNVTVLKLFGNEIADKQLEWTGDKKIWWNDLRIVHGSLYLLFSYMAFNQNKDAWLILLIDTLIGLVSWTKYHKLILGLSPNIKLITSNQLI